MKAANPFLTLVIAGMLSRFSYQMARSPVLPRFAQDLGSSPELIGLIVAASTITGIFIKLPAGALSDILGRRRMLLLGAFFFAAPPFLYPLVKDPISLLVLRFFHGFATAIFSPVASAFVADIFQKGRGEKLGWFASANDVGATLGPAVGGFILFSTASYPVTYLVVGGLGLLPLLIVLRLPAEERTPAPATANPGRWAQFKTGIHEVVLNRAVIIASALEAAMYVGYGAFLGFFPLYARGIGYNDAAIGLIMGGQLATTMMGKPAGGWLSDRIGRKPMILLGLVLCASSLPLIVMGQRFFTLLALSCLLGLGVAIVTPSTTALVADLAKAGRMGSAMGVFGTIWDSGEAAGPILAGFLIASLSYSNGFLIISILMAAAAATFALTVKDPLMAASRQAQE
ncbi:MAG: MFS transporter, partial [Candidatus Tectomicrobia bacterium]|nr:MFS transporter [Candidatus Tectomicrobia bacterium]